MTDPKRGSFAHGSQYRNSEHGLSAFSLKRNRIGVICTETIAERRGKVFQGMSKKFLTAAAGFIAIVTVIIRARFQ
jgi:hypothetical protein